MGKILPTKVIHENNTTIEYYGSDLPIIVETEYKKVNKVHKSSHFVPTPKELDYYGI